MFSKISVYVWTGPKCFFKTEGVYNQNRIQLNRASFGRCYHCWAALHFKFNLSRMQSEVVEYAYLGRNQSDCSKLSRDKLSNNQDPGFIPRDLQNGGLAKNIHFVPLQRFVLIDSFPSKGRIRRETRQKSLGLRRVCRRRVRSV